MTHNIQQRLDHYISYCKAHPKTTAVVIVTGLIALRAIPDILGALRDWNKPSLEKTLFDLISVKTGLKEAQRVSEIINEAKLSLTWKRGLSITVDEYRGSCQIDPIGLRLIGIGWKLSKHFQMFINNDREKDLEEFDAWRPIALKVVELHEGMPKKKIGLLNLHKFIIGEIMGFFSEHGGSRRLLSKPFDEGLLREKFSDEARVRGIGERK